MFTQDLFYTFGAGFSVFFVVSADYVCKTIQYPQPFQDINSDIMVFVGENGLCYSVEVFKRFRNERIELCSRDGMGSVEIAEQNQRFFQAFCIFSRKH